MARNMHLSRRQASLPHGYHCCGRPPWPVLAHARKGRVHQVLAYHPLLRNRIWDVLADAVLTEVAQWYIPPPKEQRPRLRSHNQSQRRKRTTMTTMVRVALDTPPFGTCHTQAVAPLVGTGNSTWSSDPEFSSCKLNPYTADLASNRVHLSQFHHTVSHSSSRSFSSYIETSRNSCSFGPFSIN